MITGTIIAVSFASNAAKYAIAEVKSHLRVELSPFTSFLDFFFRSGGTQPAESLRCLRYRYKEQSTAAAIKGSGTVTQLTDSVWAGCKAKSRAARIALQSRRS